MDISWRKILFHLVRSHEGSYHITSKGAAVNGKIENFEPSPMCSFPDEIYEGIQCHRAVVSTAGFWLSFHFLWSCSVPVGSDSVKSLSHRTRKDFPDYPKLYILIYCVFTICVYMCMLPSRPRKCREERHKDIEPCQFWEVVK